MQVERDGTAVRITLEASEVNLLRYALERASFIDTPSSEQSAIATFCGRVLDALGSSRSAP
jgi:hypothetical protein